MDTFLTGNTFLTGKNAVVTGGTRGIGRAIAEALAIAGAGVAICGRTQDNVDNAVIQLTNKSKSKVVGKVADVRSSTEVSSFFEYVDRELGQIDIVVNNAGVGVFKSTAELSVEEWQKTLDTNLSGVFYCSKEALQRIRGRGGYIINVGSLAGKNAFAGGAAYNASKFGLNGLSEATMLDKRDENVRVSYIMPGSVSTEFGGHGAGSGSEWKIWPEDVAEIVRMLLTMPKRTLVSR